MDKAKPVMVKIQLITAKTKFTGDKSQLMMVNKKPVTGKVQFATAKEKLAKDKIQLVAAKKKFPLEKAQSAREKEKTRMAINKTPEIVKLQKSIFGD